MAAIYQWFVGDVQILTTTIYPIEAEESLQTSVSFDAGYAGPIQFEKMDYGMTLLSMDVFPILIELPEEEDKMDYGMTLLSMDVFEVLINIPAQEDKMDYGMTLLDMDVIPRLITIYSPDEELKSTIYLDSANCSMTPV